jgi:hypothetical protein
MIIPLLFVVAARLFLLVAASPAIIPASYYVAEISNNYLDVSDAIDDITKYARESNAQVQLRYLFDSDLLRGFSFEWLPLDSARPVSDVVDTLSAHTGILQVWPLAKRNHQSLSSSTTSNSLRAWKREPARFEGESHAKSHAISHAKRDDNIDTGGVLPTHRMSNVDKLHAAGIKGRGVKVAVVDSCFDYKQDVFGGSIGPENKITYGYNWATNTSEPYCDCTTHGTYDLGVLAANPTRFNVSGVAPEASIELHAILTCDQQTFEDDYQMYIVSEIAKRKVDIITYSYTTFTSVWPNSALSVLWSRIQASGIFVNVAAGNAGNGATPFDSRSPGNGIAVNSIASVNNIIKPYISWNGTYSLDGDIQPIQYYPLMSNGGPPIFPPNLKVWTPSAANVTNNPGTRVFGQPECQDVPGPLPNADDTIFLLDYFACWNLNGTYISPLAKYLVWFVPYATPGISSYSVVQGGTTNNGTGIIDYDIARSWVEAMEAGQELRVSLATGSAYEVSYHQVDDDIAGGRLVTESTMGPTLDMRIGPTFAAPGARILSTTVKALGGFGTSQGTSLAAPFVAGCAALIKQVHAEWAPATISNALALTAKPMPNNDYSDKDFGYLAPTQGQGAGLVDCYAAAYSTTFVNVTSLSFNTTRYPTRTLAFRVANNATTAQTYSLNHVPAGSFYAFANGNRSELAITNDVLQPPSMMVESYADVTIDPPTITIPSFGSVDVEISLASLPQNVDTSRLPIYGGYITLNSTNSEAPDEARFDYSIPYTGVAGELYDISVLDEIVAEAILSDDSTSLGPVEEGHVFNLTYTNGTITGDAYPGFFYNAVISSQRYIFEVVDYSSNETVVSDEFVGNATPNPYVWNGTPYVGPGVTDKREFLPAGKYFLRATGLRMEGQWNTVGDYVVRETDWFEIRYNGNSTGLPSS